MNQIMELYKGVDVSLDHGSTGVDALFGLPKNLRISRETDGVAIRGDLKVMETNQDRREKVFAIAESEPHLLKFSHEIPEGGYRIDRKSNPPSISEVSKVRRIALITGTGGVNNTIFEHELDPKMEIKTTKDLQEQFPLVADKLIEENRENILQECPCKKEGGAIEQVAKLKADLKEREDKITELESKVAEFEASKKLEERKHEIRTMAKTLKRACDDDIIELCMQLPVEEGNGNVKRILEMQSEIKEGEPDPKPTYKKPTQEPGTGATPTVATWITTRGAISRTVQGYINS